MTDPWSPYLNRQGAEPVPEPMKLGDVAVEVVIAAAKASSSHFENCDFGESWQDCNLCRHAYDRAHYAVAAARRALERQVRERLAAELLERAAGAPAASGFRRGLRAAAHIVGPHPTPGEVAEAVRSGDFVACDPVEDRP